MPYNIHNIGNLVRVQISGPHKRLVYVPFSALPDPFKGPAPVDQWRDAFFQYFYEFEDKQYWYGFFRVNDSGDGEFSHWYANGKAFDGDTYASVAILVDGDGNEMHTFAAHAGVNAGGSERAVNQTLSKPLEWWRKAAGFKFAVWKIDTVDDKAMWVAVETIVSSALESE